MRILAVDDDPMILDVLRLAMAEAGHGELATAESADEAHEIIAAAEEPFECFLLDIQMPGTDGITLCREIRALPDYPETPILMLTAMGAKPYIDRAFAAGATDYVTKPFDGMELGVRIRLASQLSNALRRARETEEAGGRIALGEQMAFEEIEGVISYVALENYLLKFPEGLFSMRLFTVHIAGIEMLHETLSGRGFRKLVGRVAESLVGELGNWSPLLAYAGNGRFAGVITGHRVPGEPELQTKVRNAEHAASDKEGMMLGLELVLPSRVTLWTGRRAAEGLDRSLIAAE